MKKNYFKAMLIALSFAIGINSIAAQETMKFGANLQPQDDTTIEGIAISASQGKDVPISWNSTETSTMTYIPNTLSSIDDNFKLTYTSYEDALNNTQQKTHSIPESKLNLAVGYVLIFDKADDTSAWGLSFLLSYNKYMTDLFYSGLGVGYDFQKATEKYGTQKYEATTSILKFPIYFGITPVKGVNIDTGPSFAWIVGGGVKAYDGSSKIDESKYKDDEDFKSFAPTWRVYLTLAKYIYVGIDFGLKKGHGTTMTFGISF